MDQDQSSTAHPTDAHSEHSRPSLLRPEGSLQRVDSSASFITEACHIEDVNAGCQIHSHSSDGGLSHYTLNGISGEIIHEAQGVQEHLHQIPEDIMATGGTEAPPGASTSRLVPPAISISDTNDHSETLVPTGTKSISDLAAATFLPPPNGTTPGPTSDTDVSSRTSADINWGFDDMNDLLRHETGDLTRENIQALGEEQGRSISPIERANTPPVPPKVESKPQPESSSDEEEERDMEDHRSPFDDETTNGDDTEIFNSIFVNAGAGLPGSQQTSSHGIFDSQPEENDGADFFSTLGGDSKNGLQHEHEQAQTQPKGDLPLNPLGTVGESLVINQQENSASSFFDKIGEYDGGDFFSSSTNAQQPLQNPQQTFTTQVTAVTVEGAHFGGVGASTATAISEIFSTIDEVLPEEADFFANPSQSQNNVTAGDANAVEDVAAVEDIAAKWKAALAADELLDDDFLPDDEGFLSSDEEDGSTEAPSSGILKPVVDSSGALQGFSSVTPVNISSTASRYAPQTSTPPINSRGPYQPPQQQYTPQVADWQPQIKPYAPFQQPPVNRSLNNSQTSVYNTVPANTGHYPPAPAPRQFPTGPSKPPPAPKTQSFVDKKGSYQSPYDLPMEVVKPALSKRVSMPQMSPSLTSPPPRQSSIGAGATPPIAQGAFGPPIHSVPPGTPNFRPPPPQPKPSTPAKSAFFEDLPVVTKPKQTKYAPQVGMVRSESLPGAQPPRPNSTYQPPPSQTAKPSLGPAPVLNSRYAAPPVPQTPSQAPSVYAPATPGSTNVPPQYPAVPPTPPMTSHYTQPATGPTALPSNQGLVSPPQPLPYQRAPSAPLPLTGIGEKYGVKSANSTHEGSLQQHSPSQVRYFAEHHHLHSSRPGTGKSTNFTAGFGMVKEEDEAAAAVPAQPPVVTNSKYAPRSTATPPPSSGPPVRGVSRVGTLSPPSRTASPGMYSAVQQQVPSRTASPESFAPPRRAQTQSPSTLMNGPKRTVNQYQPSQHVPRPASALAHATTISGFSPVEQHTRSMSAGVKNFMNDPVHFMPPQDTSIHDPLNRWQGCPIFSWGFGGHVVTMFPTRTQRNALGMSQPMIKCSQGEVKIRHIKDVLPLENSLAKFPGPVYTGGKGSKSKKKEILTWMTEKIVDLEKDAGGLGMFLPGEPVPDEATRKKTEEKILLWKGMKIFLENDGNIEGPEIEKSIRAILWPTDSAAPSSDSFSLVTSMTSSSIDSSLGPLPDRVDAEAIKTIKTHLLNGDRTAAVWHAVDKRLWSHAMLIAGTVSQELWKQVVQDFVRSEVKTLGNGIESLAALYEIFGGNGEESMDELVPQSARLGQPMMTSVTGTVSAKDPLEGLEKWRETLALIMSNRSASDTNAITALGRLLGTYARVEAAHLCYLFAKNLALFGGSDDPNTAIALFGADHQYSPFTFWKDTDAILLSEVYELAVSLAPAPAAPAIIPHLQGIKVYHAFLLAESGYRTEAQKYCEAIHSVLKTSTKPSPYFHRIMFNYLEDLTNRVSQSPKDAATDGWLSKPSLDNISGSMWVAFTKFVAGDDNGPGAGAENGPNGGGLVSGPFGSTSVSPGMSRTQSSADIYGGYGNPVGGNYTPTSKQYNPMTSTNSYAPQQQGYAPQSASSGNPYDPSSSYGSYNPVANTSNTYHPAHPPQPPQSSYEATGGQQSPYISQSGYEPASAKSAADSPAPHQTSFDSPKTNDNTRGYMPPSYEPPTTSYGYEPPTNVTPYQPPEAEATAPEKNQYSEDEKPKPKKKSFMDDDDDAEFLARAAALNKEAEEKKKKQEEEKKKEAAAAGGSGWFKGWFGKKDTNTLGGGPTKAKLGEESSFYYDPDLKRWINKKAAPEDQGAPKAALPPPKRASNPPSRPGSAIPPPPSPAAHSQQKSHSVPPMNTTFPPPTPGSDGPSTPLSTAPPMRFGTPGTPAGPPLRTGTPGTPSAGPPMRVGTPSTPNAPPSRLGTPAPSTPGTPASLPPPSASAPPPSAGPPPPGRSAPPSRPSTAAPSGGSNDILDDLLGGPAGLPRKGQAGKKGRKGGRYVDVMAK